MISNTERLRCAFCAHDAKLGETQPTQTQDKMLNTQRIYELRTLDTG